MFACLYVNGVTVDTVDYDPDTVTLEFGTDAHTAYRCGACGDDLAETVAGLEGEWSGWNCPNYEPDDGPDDDRRPHVPERVPLSWCNSAGISADDSDDSVTVSLSVGDPRGAFTFVITRVPDDADSDLAGRLILHTPYPGEPAPHKTLQPIRPGAYIIGGRSAGGGIHSVPGGHAA